MMSVIDLENVLLDLHRRLKYREAGNVIMHDWLENLDSQCCSSKHTCLELCLEPVFVGQFQDPVIPGFLVGIPNLIPLPPPSILIPRFDIYFDS